MNTTERIRELRTDLPTEAELRYKTEQGWRLGAVEWQRDVEIDERAPRPFRQTPPFGQRVADDALVLEDDPAEHEVLQAILALVIEDGMSFAGAATTLNERGHTMRDGTPWTQIAIFELMPRIVETAPRIMADPTWAGQRPQRAAG